MPTKAAHKTKGNLNEYLMYSVQRMRDLPEHPTGNMRLVCVFQFSDYNVQGVIPAKHRVPGYKT